MTKTAPKGTSAFVRTPRPRPWSPRLSPRLVVIQAAALIVLALGTTWLLAHRDARIENAQLIQRARALAALAAQASGPDLRERPAAHLYRILEYATDEGLLTAAALIDSAGVVVAHSDVSRAGLQTTHDPHAAATTPGMVSALSTTLFGEPGGQVILHPVIGKDGPVGTVALLLPKASALPSHGSGLGYLLPAALLLLAFIAATRISVRHALQPTSEAVGRLAAILKGRGSADTTLPPSQVEYERAVELAAQRVKEVSEKHEALLVENRVLAYERSRMRLTVDHMPVGVIVTHTTGRVTTFNRAASAMLGVPPDEAVGCNVNDLPLGVEPGAALSEKTAQSLLKPPHGDSNRQILLRRTTLTASDGEVIGTLYTLRDITAQKSAEKAQMEFLSQISHELKAPLNTIVTYVDALADNELMAEDERIDFYNTIAGEAHRMAHLISNLLQLSRIELGNLSARFGFVKPTQLVTDITDALRRQAEARSQVMRVDTAENLSPLFGDKDLLGVALTNLITNAIKYTGDGGTISVRACAEGNGIRLEVEDTGIGIPEEEISNIFERFVRSEQEEVRRQPGSGLGLALVQEIIRLHDGTISVDSKPGQGSQFRVWLPSREVGDRLDLAAA